MANDTNTISSKEQRIVLKRLFTYLKPHKKLLAIALFLLVLTVIGDIIGPYLIKVYIDDHLMIGNFDMTPILILGISYFMIQLLNVFITYYQNIKFQQLALKVIQQLRIDVFTKIHKLGMRYFDKVPAMALSLSISPPLPMTTSRLPSLVQACTARSTRLYQVRRPTVR